MSVPPSGLPPPPPARVHFVGLGGIGMSGLARILHAWGYAVSGSDAVASPLLEELAREGIAVTVGHTATAEAAAAELVVATAAVPETNLELAAARAGGRPIVKRAELLGALVDAREGIAVAGSHGKSTTSGMLATALMALGARPSYAVGATLGPGGTNAAPGDGPHFVAEADEYDRSFLWLHPALAVVTNVDYDHPDIFPDLDAYDAAFAAFVAGIRRDGTLVLAADDPGCRRLLARADWDPPARVVTFGETADVDWRLRPDPAGGWVVAARDGSEIPLALRVPGRHNARNALAALAALAALTFDPAAAATALAEFTGVGRRFERKGEAVGVLVIDDYAHHPTELRATLAAARERFSDRRLWALFQPHTFSRLKALLPDFAAAFADADEVVILDVYAARETDDLGVSAADLRVLLPGANAAADPAAAARLVAELARPGDVVLTLGAGSVTEVGPRLLELLAERALTPYPSPDPRERGDELLRPASVFPPEGDDSRRFPLSRASGEGAGGEGSSGGCRTATANSRAAAETIPSRPHLKLLRDAPLRLYATWRVGGPADWLVRAPTPDDLRAAVAWSKERGLPITVIGGGSNLLVGDRGIRGLVVLARTPGERAEGLVTAEDVGEAVRLTVAAQAPLSWTGRYAAERGWAGLDWGVGLPGTIGGATVNNAGAHGTEQKDHLCSVTLLDLETGEEVTQSGAWLEAAYRHTRIKAAPRPRPWVVLSVELLLPKGDPAALVRLADEHADFRKQTQPGGATGGSTFANPPGDHAGRLLEAVGMKGARLGGARFSPKHANWIVNEGEATAADIRALIAEARRRVRAAFGIELRQEVEEIGEP